MPEPVTSVHFVGGEKGGVGKTVLARLLCHQLLQAGRDFASVDADTSQRALSRGYESTLVDLSLFSSADGVMDRALRKEGDVVVDLPSHSHRALARWFEESEVPALAKEHAVRLVFWYVTDGGYASVSFLERMRAWLSESMELVVVRNQRWSEEFSRLLASGVWAELSERGARSFDLPGLDPALMFELDRRGGHFGRALRVEKPEATSDSSTPLTPMQRRRLMRWLRLIDDRLPALMEGRQQGREASESLVEEEADSSPSQPSVSVETTSVATRERPPVGTTWIDGATTWTEVADNALIHHVRCP